jgi:hypothetical protein
LTATIARPFRRLLRDEEPEWLVWALVAGMIVIGLLVRTVFVARTVEVTADNLSVAYPADWISMTTDDPYDVLARSEPMMSNSFPASVRIMQMPVTELSTTADSLDDFALKWSDRQIQDLEGYRVLSIEPVSVQGTDAAQINYAYIAEPLLGGPGAMPVVARGQDVLIPRDATLTVVRFVADADAYDSLGATWERILGSLEMQQGVETQ